jgi:hypothetical protein
MNVARTVVPITTTKLLSNALSHWTSAKNSPYHRSESPLRRELEVTRRGKRGRDHDTQRQEHRREDRGVAHPERSDL